METLTIELNREQLEQLRARAHREARSVEETASAGLEEWLAERQAFEQAADYVLEKNAELHRRLS